MEGIFTREYRLPESVMRPLRFAGKVIISVLAIVLGPGVIRLALQAQARHEYQQLTPAIHSPALAGAFFLVAVGAGLLLLASAYFVWRSRLGLRLFIVGTILGNLSMPLGFVSGKAPSTLWQMGLMAIALTSVFTESYTPRPAKATEN